jgi:hypothetical protein
MSLIDDIFNLLMKEYKEAISAIEIDPSENSRLMHYDRQIEDLQSNIVKERYLCLFMIFRFEINVC